MNEKEYSSIWELYGLRSNPFSTKPLLVKGGNIPIESFFGRRSELDKLNRIFRSSGGSCALVSGDVGVGKTTFVNYARWGAMSGNFFTPFKEIAVQPEWSANDFILNTLAAIHSSIQLLDIEKKMDKDLWEKIEAVFSTIKSVGKGYSLGLLGTSAGVDESRGRDAPEITNIFLSDLFAQLIDNLKKIGFKETIIHYNNLEIISEKGESQIKAVFTRIRDFIQTPDVHFIFVGDLNVPGIIESIPRVSQIFSNLPITLETFSKKDIESIIKKRLDALKIKDLKLISPCDDSAISVLHELYSGNIRSILNSLATAIVNTVKESAVILNGNTVKEILNGIAKKEFSNKVGGNEAKVLMEMVNHEEITNSELATILKMKGQNISKYINRLKEINCIYLRRTDGTHRFYSVRSPVKWILLKPSTKEQNIANYTYTITETEKR